MIFLAKFLILVKKYWQIGLLILGVVIGAFVFKKTDDSFADKFKKIQDAHDEELKKIEEAHVQERHEHEINVKKLQDTLDVIQKQYNSAKKDLDDNKKKEIEEIVKKYHNDPDSLTKRLSDVTGFIVVLPE